MSDVTSLPQYRSSVVSLPVFNMPYNKSSFTDVYSRMGALLNFTMEYLKTLIAQNLADRQTIETLIRETERAFDLYIGPIDLPWIPNLVEPYIDAQMRASIRPTIEAAAKYFLTAAVPVPVPAPAPVPVAPPKTPVVPPGAANP